MGIPTQHEAYCVDPLTSSFTDVLTAERCAFHRFNTVADQALDGERTTGTPLETCGRSALSNAVPSDFKNRAGIMLLVPIDALARMLDKVWMAGHYRSFEDLAASEQLGINYRICIKDRCAPFVILALHGGSIEPVTSEITEAIAGLDLSFYGFEAAKDGRNGALSYNLPSFRRA